MWIWGFLLAGALAQTTTQLPVNEWSQLSTPSKGVANSIGFYDEGCLAGAKALPLDGTGYQVMRTSRNRYYGHPDTLQFVQDLAKQMDDAGSGILIGDMGQVRGGPLPYGHASHQIGLDVDIWFWTHPEQRIRSLTTDERDHLPFIDMLNAAGTAVDTQHFDPNQILKLKLASENPAVQRIFVNAVIKAYLCKSIKPKDRVWLHKLRPWEGHNEHFHVRLSCPANSECIPQTPIPDGDGCVQALAQAKIEIKKPTHQDENRQKVSIPKRAPVLPDHCEQVLKEMAQAMQNNYFTTVKPTTTER